MLASLGMADVLVLRNHGVAVCRRGHSRRHSCCCGTVQRAAEIQCQAGMLPGPNAPTLTDAVRQHCADTAARLVAARCVRHQGVRRHGPQDEAGPPVSCAVMRRTALALWPAMGLVGRRRHAGRRDAARPLHRRRSDPRPERHRRANVVPCST